MDCVEYEGALGPLGYGIAHRYVDGVRRTLGAHRLAWIETHGEIPEGLCVCHSCDNPACVNVEHLWLGTHGDNARDRMSKGRNGDNGLRHRSHCSNGHPFNGGNLVMEGRKRRCRQCIRDRANAYNARKRAA